MFSVQCSVFSIQYGIRWEPRIPMRESIQLKSARTRRGLRWSQDLFIKYKFFPGSADC